MSDLGREARILKASLGCSLYLFVLYSGIFLCRGFRTPAGETVFVLSWSLITHLLAFLQLFSLLSLAEALGLFGAPLFRLAFGERSAKLLPVCLALLCAAAAVAAWIPRPALQIAATLAIWCASFCCFYAFTRDAQLRLRQAYLVIFIGLGLAWGADWATGALDNTLRLNRIWPGRALSALADREPSFRTARLLFLAAQVARP